MGEIRFHEFSSDGRSARLAIGIWEPSNWNRGYGGEAIERALEYGFDELELHFVELYVLENNARARHACAKCGFREVTLLPDRVFADGRWRADVVMSITGDEWRARGRPEGA
ncbi:MAG: GNAT family N-acetyltransferase [Chloroflexi bacterium]|nr:GNAT family N-acetyltransferase [Chloroflexota bacterium]